MVERSAGQPEVRAGESELDDMGQVLPRQVGMGEHDPLGSSGGARGVHQSVDVVGRHRHGLDHLARAWRADRPVWSTRSGREKRCEARTREASMPAVASSARLDQRAVADQGPGPGVLEDVAHLGCGQAPVDGHGHRTQVVGGEDRLEELGAVVGEERHHVASADSVGRQAPGQSDGPPGHLPIGHGPALEHRHGLVGRTGGVVGQHREPVHVGCHGRCRGHRGLLTGGAAASRCASRASHGTAVTPLVEKQSPQGTAR